MRHVSILNDQQREAIRATEPIRVVSASPGTGKTATVAGLVKWWTGNGVSPSSILVVTFTRKAAGEMMERIERLCGDRVAADVTVSTLHSWAYSVMRAFPASFGLSPGGVTIYDEEDMYDVCKELDELMRLKVGASGVVLMIERLKCMMPVGTEENKQRMIAEYERWCRECNAIDFSTMMRRFAEMLANPDHDVSQWSRNRWRHIIVDEAQDMDTAQRNAVVAVADCMPCKGDRAAVFVGDEDQSIYMWRGTSPGLMTELANEGALYRLERSYRCAGEIVKAAANLISWNWSAKRVITTENKSDGKVDVVTCKDSIDESENVVAWVRRRVMSCVAPESIAVIARTRARLADIAAGLKKEGIPCTFVGQRAGLFRSEAGKRVLSTLRLAVNQRDGLSFLRIRRFLRIGLEEFCQMRLEASAKGVSVFMLWSEKYRSADTELSTAAKPLNSTTEQVLTWAAALFSDMQAYNIIAAIKVMAKRNRLETPGDVLAWIERIEFADDDAEVEGVHVGTIHSVKGLEFDAVAVVGCEQGHLPHKRAPNMQEERRLMFVAITRAREEVHITHAETVYEGNEGVVRKPSQFIDELRSCHE